MDNGPIDDKDAAVLRLFLEERDVVTFQVEGGPASKKPEVPYGHVRLDRAKVEWVRDKLNEWLEKEKRQN